MNPHGFQNTPEVAPLDGAQIDPASFAEEEVEYAYFLKHLSTLANAVVLTGEHRGFIDLKVWRRPQDNEPYNARILENHASLAFFYTEKSPWNPYYGNAALKVRLEAVMDFWCRIQHSDGRFSEYAPEQWSLAPTGFGIKFMGETLRRLHESEKLGGPTIDQEILLRTVKATQKAIQVLLTHPDLLRHAKNFSNQYTGFWGGMLAFVSAYPDEDLYRAFLEKIAMFREELTSPVGYHYERTGCDWRYTMYTHRSNMRHVWFYAHGTALEKTLVDMERPWVDWLSYNAVLEPDRGYFTLNRAIETRTALPGFSDWETPMAEHIPLAHAFTQSQEAYREHLQQAKEKLVNTWPSVAPLDMYSPHIFENGRNVFEWLPDREQRDKARAQLPYLTQARYNHFRMDDRIVVHHTFVRRPNYYAIFNAGEIIHNIQRYGLGLLWHPKMGSILQTQSREDGPWGTMGKDGKFYEAESFYPDMMVNGKAFQPTPGKRDLPDGDIVFNYALDSAGKKTVRFEESQIAVDIELPGMFTEHLPLLVREGDDLQISGKQVCLQRGDHAMVILCESTATVDVQTTDVAHGPFVLKRVKISAKDRLLYRIVFE